jgi:hypothetical protein
MSSYSDGYTSSQAGDWLLGTARRNPEALLLLAAGCALLMRNRAGSLAKPERQSHYGRDEPAYRSHQDYRSDRSSGGSDGQSGISRVAETASEYASNVKNKVAEAAGGYAESVSRFAEETGRNVSQQSDRLRRKAQSTLQDGMNRVLREQPLAVAVAGLAAGAAVAALFPRTEIENRTLGPAHDALTEAASQAGENLMGAAGKAGERLKTAAAERGLTSEGIKDLAGDVAGTFTSAVTGKSDRGTSASSESDGTPTLAPQSPGSDARTSSEGPRSASPANMGPGGRNAR